MSESESSEPKKIGRRDFLKKMGQGAIVGAAVGSGVVIGANDIKRVKEDDKSTQGVETDIPTYDGPPLPDSPLPPTPPPSGGEGDLPAGEPLKPSDPTPAPTPTPKPHESGPSRPRPPKRENV